MSRALKRLAKKVLYFAIAMVPWLVCMYGFYWLDASGAWSSETPHREKTSVALLTTGMVLSFLIQSHFFKRESRST